MPLGHGRPSDAREFANTMSPSVKRFVGISLLIVLTCNAASDGAQGDRVFHARYRGGGASLHEARRDDRLYPVNINNWWGHINQAGNLVVFPRFDWTGYDYEGLARAVLDERTGFINFTGNWQIEPLYVYADRFSDSHAIVGDGRKFGFINTEGRRIAHMQFDGALRFSDGLAAVRIDDRCGFIDKTGRIVIPLRYARVRSFKNGTAVAQLPGQSSRSGMITVIDKTGQTLFADEQRQFQHMGDFSEGMARVSVNRKWGFIDREFNIAIEPAYDEARDFYAGLAAVRVQTRWGYIDQEGKMVIPPQFEYAGDFSEVMALVKSEGRFGFINRVGRFSIPLQFNEAEPFFRNYARVSQEPNFGYVNVVGQVIWDPRAPIDQITDGEAAARGINRTVQPPRWREPIARPYPLEHQYVPELPQPDRHN